MKRRSSEKFWVPCRRHDEKTGELRVGGYLLCSLRIYPMDQAEKFEQGVGRDEPNNDPHCPEPEGRIKLTLNPFEMFN